jgi:Arc/MetJ-type ribon-helix-helix transcriptional regulator
MDVHLPEDLQEYVQSEVLCGHFASEQDAIEEAVRLLRLRRQPNIIQPNPLTQEQLEQQLLETGFLGSIPPPRTAASSRREFQPVPIEGEPLSETIIRERR